MHNGRRRFFCSQTQRARYFRMQFCMHLKRIKSAAAKPQYWNFAAALFERMMGARYISRCCHLRLICNREIIAACAFSVCKYINLNLFMISLAGWGSNHICCNITAIRSGGVHCPYGNNRIVCCTGFPVDGIITIV